MTDLAAKIAELEAGCKGILRMPTSDHVIACDPQTILALIAAWRAEKARADGIGEKYKGLVQFYDAHAGTPCEQIRHEQETERLNARIAALEADNKRLREALEPSAATKAEYIGEFKISVPFETEDGDGEAFDVTIPWTAIKEIMAAIKKRADSQGTEQCDLDVDDAEFGMSDHRRVSNSTRIAALEAENKRLRGSFKWQDGPPV
jgi:hypothetical protein